MEVIIIIYRPMYVDKMMAYADAPFVKAMTGIRRCGKSTVLKMIMEKLQTCSVQNIKFKYHKNARLFFRRAGNSMANPKILIV